MTSGRGHPRNDRVSGFPEGRTALGEGTEHLRAGGGIETRRILN